jgi:drug/metabolite transporter (DMT)-like permease
MTERTRAHIGVLCTNLFFAANYSLVKMISPALVKPFALNVVRLGISLLLFWTVWLFGGASAGIKSKHWPSFFWCSVTGVAINQMLFIKGLTLTSTIHAALLILATPLLVTVFALWILKEGFTIFKAAGLLLGIVGSVVLISQREGGEHATNYLLGDLLVLVNAISYAIYFILVKPLMKEYSPLHVIRWIFSLGFLMVLPFGWKELMEVEWTGFAWQHLTALLSIAVTGTFLAYYFNAYGIQHIGASATGTYIYTQPVFAVVIATLILNEQLTWQKMMAALLIFGGVYLVSFRRGTNEVVKTD